MQATRTYLQLTDPGEFRQAFGDFPGLVVARVAEPTAALYRSCYRTVGEAYHWRDRWNWSDGEILAHVRRPEISLHVAERGERFAGWYELRRVAPVVVPRDQRIADHDLALPQDPIRQRYVAR